MNQDAYEILLSTCTQYQGALALLKQYRPYLETLPSMRRPSESLITLPLPNVRVRQAVSQGLAERGDVVPLPCEVVFLMCDPEWKIKTGVEICVYIHRPHEDFSELLSRWRRTELLLDGGYEWLMPMYYRHLLSEGADQPLPLFVVFPDTPSRILRGLQGARLPVVEHVPHLGAIADPVEPPAAPDSDITFEDVGLEAETDGHLGRDDLMISPDAEEPPEFDLDESPSGDLGQGSFDSSGD